MMIKSPQFSRGKYALAWATQNAVPTILWQPTSLIDGIRSRGACHKIGLKSDEEIRKLRERNAAQCDQHQRARRRIAQNH